MQNNNSQKNQAKYKTHHSNYTELLLKKQGVGWNNIIDIQWLYRWNLRRLEPGFTLDIGCGIGRNLTNLRGVGIDHNLQSVKVARERGLITFSAEEFENSLFNNPHQFDSLLLSHVAEHMTKKEVVELLRKYISLLKPGGKLIMITPQEAGYRSDVTHVEFINFLKLRQISNELTFTLMQEYSFPFPRFWGYLFIYNEFISISYKSENRELI